MLFAMYGSSWAYVLGSTLKALDRLGVEAAEHDRRREPHDDDDAPAATSSG